MIVSICLSLVAESLYQACSNRPQVFWTGVRSYILVLLWELQVSAQHCNVTPPYQAIWHYFRTLSHYYICSDIPSETYWNNAGFFIFMEKSTTSRPGRKGNNPVVPWYSEKGRLSFIHTTLHSQIESEQGAGGTKSLCSQCSASNVSEFKRWQRTTKVCIIGCSSWCSKVFW